jgi:signal transduction histidine kinase
MTGDDAIHAEMGQSLAAGRRMLWLGFGSILLLMALIGFDVARSAQRTTAKNAELIKSFRGRDQILDELRNIVIRSGTMIRDYLSETDPARAQTEKADIEAARKQTEQILEAYAGPQGRMVPMEQKTFIGLKSGLDTYWSTFAPVLQWDAATKKMKGEAYRQDAIGPLRTEVLRLSRDITNLNDQQLDAGEQSIQDEQTKLRNRLIIASALGVGIACVLAVFVTIRIQRLERAAEIQYQKISQARRELRELTGRLESAQEEERKKLSRELHDEVGQSMSAMLVELGRLEAVLPRDEALRARLAAFRKQAESSVRTVRDMSLLLRPSMLDDLGLVAALKWQGREVSRNTGLNVHIDAEDASDRLPDSHRTCIYRVVQEALHNCAKHAKATSVRVVVKQSPGVLEASVQDDGAGFDPASEKGLGLLGMEERVARLGGAVRLDSTQGHGTVLSVRLPVPASEEGS